MQHSRLFEDPGERYTKWFSFENPEGKRGAGGMKNKGMKGAPCETIHPGESFVLAHHKGTSGIIDALWLAVDSFRKPEGINALKIEFFWEGNDTPAVCAPLEEFFCHATSTHKNPFENWLFSSPEGRSFNCFVPMPFKEECKVVVTNTTKDLNIVVFYCLQMTCNVDLPENFLYFHSLYQPTRRTKHLEDFVILPKIEGRGRYLGTNVQMHAAEGYTDTWFGEGEIKIYLDGDDKYPTLVGTGTEDYILSAYGQGVFSSMRSGCTLNDTGEDGCITTAFHRVHVEDPVYFTKDCKVTLQQIGGADPKYVRAAVEFGAPVLPTSTTLANGDMLWGDDAVIDHPEGVWVNFMREDYVSSVAYFYLNRPVL